MKANTIRLEAALLRELGPLLKPKQSLASFVREALLKLIEAHKLKLAAEKYAHLLAVNPEEAAFLEEWDTADLSNAPKHRGKR